MSAGDYFNLIWDFGTMSQTLKVYSDVRGMRKKGLEKQSRYDVTE